MIRFVFSLPLISVDFSSRRNLKLIVVCIVLSEDDLIAMERKSKMIQWIYCGYFIQIQLTYFDMKANITFIRAEMKVAP